MNNRKQMSAGWYRFWTLLIAVIGMAIGWAVGGHILAAVVVVIVYFVALFLDGAI